MKLYTLNELKILVENSDNQEDLRRIAHEVYESKNEYGDIWIYIQTLCMDKSIAL